MTTSLDHLTDDELMQRINVTHASPLVRTLVTRLQSKSMLADAASIDAAEIAFAPEAERWLAQFASPESALDQTELLNGLLIYLVLCVRSGVVTDETWAAHIRRLHAGTHRPFAQLSLEGV